MSSDGNSVRDLRRISTSRSIDELIDQFQGNLETLAGVFSIELAGSESIIEVSKTWKRWSTLIRNKVFLQAFEKISAEKVLVVHEDKTLVEQDSLPIAERVIDNQVEMARSIYSMTEDEVVQYFDGHSDMEMLEASMAESAAHATYMNATDFIERGNLVGARVYYERAIDAFRNIGDEVMQRRAALRLANILALDGHLPEAKHVYEKVANEFQESGDGVNYGIALYNLAKCLHAAGEFEQASDCAERALITINLANVDVEGLVEGCVDLMSELPDMSPPSKQIARFRRIIKLVETLNLGSKVPASYFSMGLALVKDKQFSEGIEVATQGLQYVLAGGNVPAEQRNALLQAHQQLWVAADRSNEEWAMFITKLAGTPNNVVRLDQLCITLLNEIDSASLDLKTATTRLREAHMHEPFDVQSIEAQEGALRSAVDHTQHLQIQNVNINRLENYLRLVSFASDLAEAHEAGAATQLSLGRVLSLQERYIEAAQAFQRGAELAERTDNAEIRITMKINSAKALRKGGEWTQSIDRLNLLRQSIETDESHRLPDVYLELADLCLEQRLFGNAERAALNGLDHVTCLEGLDAATAKHVKRTEAELTNVLGLIHKYTDRYSTADQFFHSCLGFARELNDGRLQATATANLASVRFDVGDHDESVRLYNLAFQLTERLPKQSWDAVYAGRAVALSVVNQRDEARDMALRALNEKPPLAVVVQCLCVLMDTATNTSESEEVHRLTEEVLRDNPSPVVRVPLLSRLLGQPQGESEQRAMWRRQLDDAFDALEGLSGAKSCLAIVDLQDEKTESGRVTAVHYLERCMALVDDVAITNSDFDINRSIRTISSIAAQRLLRLVGADDERRLEIILRAKARATLHQGCSAPRSVGDVQIQLSQQLEPILLVEMYVLPRESLVFFLTADGLKGVEHLPITNEVLRDENWAICKLGDHLECDAAWNSEVWADVSGQFTAALSKYMVPEQPVCIVPAGFWHFLPLHACSLDGRPLIEDHAVFYGASSSILSQPGDPERRARRCLAVGVEFEAEAEWVCDWFDGQLVRGWLASPEVITMSMADKDIVHFSCHGAHNPLRPEESGLLLGHRQWLTSTVIQGNRTSADLVTLSACETAFDSVTAADDVVGLDQALLNMGAVSVLGTLWRVEAESTRRLVETFYKKLTGEAKASSKRMSKAHALQAAIADIRREKRFAHPYFWAAFKLAGGWL